MPKPQCEVRRRSTARSYTLANNRAVAPQLLRLRQSPRRRVSRNPIGRLLRRNTPVTLDSSGERPTGISITVRPDGDSWKVVIMQEGQTSDDKAPFEMISLIADRLRGQFDLKI
jgi:hypothetical protein